MKESVAYSPALAEKICDLIAGGQSLRKICDAHGMPTRRAVFKWLRTHEDFRAIYSIAVDERTDGDFEEAMEIANDVENDDKVKVMRDRLRVDTIKWRVGRMNPKKYGDKLDLNHGGTVELIGKIERTIIGADPEPAHG